MDGCGTARVEVEQSSDPVLVPRDGCPWAETAVLNPAIVRDDGSGLLHMLFRATGPFDGKWPAGNVAPYPIFLGYASSSDDGRTWDPDFSRPALAPALESRIDRMTVTDSQGRRVTNFANGCIEDPRITIIDGTAYLSAAGRMFPPGPYWIHDDPMQCAPDWARHGDHPFGREAAENVTVSGLFELDLDRLAARDYDAAFRYIGPLTDAELGDNRDAFLFPEQLNIRGRNKFVALHRPWKGSGYPGGRPGMKPSIWMACADRMEDLATGRATHRILAEPVLDWEGDRIGASWPPIRLSSSEWLLPYHGKMDTVTGYTQSFLILDAGRDGWPEIKHRCSDRLMYARHPWERDESKFKTPCVFTTAGCLVNGTLVMSYGAADLKVGIGRVRFEELVRHVRTFDASGHEIAGRMTRWQR